MIISKLIESLQLLDSNKEIKVRHNMDDGSERGIYYEYFSIVLSNQYDDAVCMCEEFYVID
jgi:hypothetical protein